MDLIVCDEVDQLYSRKETDSVTEILGELEYLGGQPTGAVVTLLCGSSSALPQLISKNAVHDASLRSEYPILNAGGVPNLNGSRYKTQRYQSQMWNHENVRVLCESFSSEGKTIQLDKETCNTLCYVLPPDLRLAKKVISDFVSSKELSNCDFDSTSRHRLEKSGDLINALNDAIFIANSKLCTQARDDPTKVGKINWSEETVPLNQQTIQSILSTKHTWGDIDLLVDSGWFTYPTPGHTTLAPAYWPRVIHRDPQTMFTKVQESLKRIDKDHVSLILKLFETIKTFFGF